MPPLSAYRNRMFFASGGRSHPWPLAPMVPINREPSPSGLRDIPHDRQGRQSVPAGSEQVPSQTINISAGLARLPYKISRSSVWIGFRFIGTNRTREKKIRPLEPDYSGSGRKACQTQRPSLILDPQCFLQCHAIESYKNLAVYINYGHSHLM